MSKKSVIERIRVTKRGKLMKRKMGLGHFRAKKSRKQLRRKEGQTPINKFDRKTFIKKYGLS